MKQALNAFNLSANRVRDIATDLTVRLPTIGGSAQARNAFQSTCCGAVVVLCGYFEAFLQDLVKQYVKEVCGRGVPFSSLPDQIQRSQVFDGANLLVRVLRRQAPWVVASHEDVLRRLHSSLSAGTYELVWEAFADTRSNPGSEVVSDMLRKCGVEKPWESVGDKCKRPGNVLAGVLDAFIEVRNQCAHTGEADVIPSTADLVRNCDDLDEIAKGIVFVLTDRLYSIK